MVWTTTKWGKYNGNEALEAVMNNEHWEDNGETSACRTCLDEVVESEIHKDALRIHVNNKIWSNKWKHTRQAKQNALSPTGALYRWTWKLNGMETIPLRLKIRKEAREMQCFDHFLAERILVITNGAGRTHCKTDCSWLLKNVEAGSFWKRKGDYALLRGTKSRFTGH